MLKLETADLCRIPDISYLHLVQRQIRLINGRRSHMNQPRDVVQTVTS